MNVNTCKQSVAKYSKFTRRRVQIEKLALLLPMLVCITSTTKEMIWKKVTTAAVAGLVMDKRGGRNPIQGYDEP